MGKVKLPHELGEDGSWKECFKNPILHKKIVKEDDEMAVIKAENVVCQNPEKTKNKLTININKKGIDESIKVFDEIVEDTKVILELAEQYRILALACLETLGTDKCKPILDVMHQQLQDEFLQVIGVNI